MQSGLSGRTALVTGASIGIGWATAHQLAAEGMRVALVARRAERLEMLADELRERGRPEPILIPADLTEPGETRRVAEETLAAFHGRLDVLVNNAGGSRPIPVDTEDDIWLEVMELNFHVARRLAHAVLPAMVAQRWGRIINVSGTSEPQSLNAANSAKAALHAWAKGLSREVGQWGITVNSLPPGRIDSEQIRTRIHPDPKEREDFIRRNIPAGRFGEPEELANVVVFLASELGSYISGELIHVDGGMRRFAF